MFDKGVIGISILLAALLLSGVLVLDGGLDNAIIEDADPIPTFTGE
jgi:hypothetical protein